MNKIYFGDNLPILKGLESESVDLIYIDPPFNTGKIQKRSTIKTVQSENGDRKGFQGKSYETTQVGTTSYSDSFHDFIDGFLRPRLEEAHRILKPYGSLYFHIDYREVHYCKILLDAIFGRECFLNEIIWAYDYGGRARSKWPPKHDNILYYVKDPENYVFNAGDIDREQYIAPGLVGPVKAERGKLPTDTWWFSYVGKKPTDIWWQTIVPTNGRERVGYPTQKPRKLLDRIIKASSHPRMLVLDFFAGSGTVGESCLALERDFILMDNNPASLEVMAHRFSNAGNIEWIGFTPPAPERGQPGQLRIADAEASLPPFAPEYLRLAAAITPLRARLEKDDDWNASPFEWVRGLSAAQKELLGTRLVAAWCRDVGLPVGQPNDSQELLIDGRVFAVAFSVLDAGGIYRFPSPGQTAHSPAIYFGISPSAAHCWVADPVPAPDPDAAWFPVDPNDPPAWLAPCGGTLDQAFPVLKAQSHRK